VPTSRSTLFHSRGHPVRGARRSQLSTSQRELPQAARSLDDIRTPGNRGRFEDLARAAIGNSALKFSWRAQPPKPKPRPANRKLIGSYFP
jgi:hypothetical protein